MKTLEYRRSLLEGIVNGCTESKPVAWVDDGRFNLYDEGFDDFGTTDLRWFPWTRHVDQVLDNASAVAVYAIDSEDKMPSVYLQELWNCHPKEVCLEMKGYYVKKVSCWNSGEEIETVMMVATVSESYDTYLFIIVN